MHDIKQGLEKLERLTEDLIESINQDFNEVGDLVGSSSLSMEPIRFPIERARRHSITTVENLNELDYHGKAI